MSRPVDQVIEFLESEVGRGRTHVFLDEGARDGLRELFLRSRDGVRGPAPAASPASSGTESGAAPALDLPGTSDKVARITALRSRAEKWQPARSLGTLRESMVFSTGNPDARLMLVGEAPGYEEERKGEPFVGPAGRKLDDILKAMGIPRADVYISNIVKFRPATKNQTTNNRKPTPEEMTSCLPFVRAEVGIVRPACIVALGGTAAEGLLGLAGTVGSMRGVWHGFEGIPVRVTYHPSYLLQSGASMQVKRHVWEDMLEVMEKLGMPISEKQRGFFLPKG